MAYSPGTLCQPCASGMTARKLVGRVAWPRSGWLLARAAQHTPPNSRIDFQMSDYSRDWKAHRFWKRLPWFAFAITAALLFAMGQFSALQRREPLLPIVWLAWVGCFVLANIRLARFVCPRCHKRFNSSLFTGGISLRRSLGKACGNCGLPLYAET